MSIYYVNGEQDIATVDEKPFSMNKIRPTLQFLIDVKVFLFKFISWKLNNFFF